MWDNIQMWFFNNEGVTINEKGIVEIPRKIWCKQVYRGIETSTGIHNWMIPSTKGSCLIFEHTHFEIV